MYRILILGSGGREHALAWKISQSPKCSQLFVAPGNAGTMQCAENVSLDILNFDQIEEFANANNVDYIIVGPEAPLVEGVYDHFENSDIKVLGPSKKASQLEGSKSFANDFMRDFNIPTAGYLTIDLSMIEQGYDFIDRQNSRIVLKADGLAAGKGVLILDDKEEAKAELKAMLEGKFGQASETVVLEEFLDGIEFSVFVLTDGKDYVILPEAKDYKRIGEGDTGLNTGGMGAVSPVPFANQLVMDKVEERIIKPTIRGLQERDYKYYGFIFLGLIMQDNEPYVIEYNCRMGDPETEVVIPRLRNDLMQLVESTFDGSLADQIIEMDERTMATVMLVSGGYPEAYEKAKKISIGEIEEKSVVFHAGTKLNNEGELISNGGRVLAISSYGSEHKEAVACSLRSIASIDFEKMNYRGDIGFDL